MTPFVRNMLLLVLLVSTTASFGQSKLKKADKLFCQLAYNEALTLYLAVVDEDSANVDPDVYYKIAQCYTENDRPIEAVEWYAKSVEYESNSPQDYLLYAQALQQDEQYAEAAKWYGKYHSAMPSDSIAIWGKRSSENYESLMRDPNYVIENVENINSSVSDIAPTFFDEKIVFSSDRDAKKYTEKTFKWTGAHFYNNFEALEIEPGELGAPELIEGGVNSKYHDGIAALSADGGTMVFTKTHDDKKKAGEDCKGRVIYNLKLVSSTFDEAANEWSNASDKPFVDINNMDYNVAHPTLSSDGTHLYFISDNPDFPGAQGGSDIYVATKSGDLWTNPMNIGVRANTPGQDVFPFIYKDTVLYFSSNSNRSNGGLGGLDIYKVKIDPKTGKAIGQAVNLGWPINSARDDFGFIIREDDAGIEYGYFSSSRSSASNGQAKGKDDIYFWRPDMPLILQVLANENCKNMPVAGANIKVSGNNEMAEGATDDEGMYRNDSLVRAKNTYNITATYNDQELAQVIDTDTNRPGDTVRVAFTFMGELTVKGAVTNSETGSPLLNSEVSLWDNKTGQTVQTVMTDEEGRFLMKLAPDMNYRVIGYKLGYQSDTVSVSTMGMRCETLEENLSLTPGRKFLTNVYFYFDKANISRYPEALEDLDALVNFLNENPTLKVEIRSHTDARGSSAYNQALAQRRSQSVKDYLIERGISASRLTPISYGEYCPTNECKDGVPCNEVQYQRNRRTEIVVLNYPNGKVLKSREKGKWATDDTFYVEGGKYNEQGKGSNWRVKEQFESKHGDWRKIPIRKNCDKEQAEYGYIVIF